MADTNVVIRKAKQNDLDDIMKIYAAARRYMAQTGNPSQWGETYPTREIIADDIRNECCYVGECEDGHIHCVFALIGGADPTYLHIDGEWLNDAPYHTVHRMASDGQYHGIFRKCMDFCKGKSRNIRIDTHENNATMRHLIPRNGFVRCGIIYLQDGSPRIAYHFSRDHELAHGITTA